MADREGLPNAPGQVYIEVEYDYEYKAKDKMVSIHQGESYMLVKKTNEDWWQVRKDEGTKAFYVPAQYVREVRRALMPPQKPALRAKPTILDICQESNENLNRRLPDMSSFECPSPSSSPSPSSDRVTAPVLPKDANHNMGSPHHCKLVAELVLLHNNNNHHPTSHSSLPRTRAESPPLKVGSNHTKSPDSDRCSTLNELPGGGQNKLSNDSESGDELSSSSTEHMQVGSDFFTRSASLMLREICFFSIPAATKQTLQTFVTTPPFVLFCCMLSNEQSFHVGYFSPSAHFLSVPTGRNYFVLISLSCCVLSLQLLHSCSLRVLQLPIIPGTTLPPNYLAHHFPDV